MAKRDKDAGDGTIATNRKAGHDYFILSKCEAGIRLAGTEVKSCRAHAVNLQDSFVRIDGNRATICHVHISPYDFGNRFNHMALRDRMLLLHKKEMLKLSQQVNEKHLALIPLRMYFKGSLVKVELALCQGKTHADKRETLRERQDLMDARRAMRK